MIDYQQKYLKYKNKYLQLKGGMKIVDLHKMIVSKPNIQIKKINKYITNIEIGSYKFELSYTYDDDENDENDRNRNNNLKSVKIRHTLHDFYMILDIYEICNNKIFGNIIKFNLSIIPVDFIVHIITYLDLEYVIDEYNFFESISYFMKINILNVNLFIPFNKVDDYKILIDFDEDTGICRSQKRLMEPEINYSINLIWINKEKDIGKCSLLSSDDTYIVNGIKRNYTDVITEKLKDNEKIFSYDSIDFDLNTMTFSLNDYKNKIFKVNYIENIKEWSRKNKKNKINLWYDSKVISINILIETIKWIYQFNNDNQDVVGIYLKNIRTANMPDNSTLLNIFDKVKHGVIHNNTSTVINIFRNIYLRVDAARLFIIWKVLQENDYCIYVDLDSTPIDQTQIFIFDFTLKREPKTVVMQNMKDSIEILDKFGFVPGIINGHTENGFMIFGSKNQMIKNFVTEYFIFKIFNLLLKNNIYTDINNSNRRISLTDAQFIYSEIGGKHMLDMYYEELKRYLLKLQINKDKKEEEVLQEYFGINKENLKVDYKEQILSKIYKTVDDIVPLSILSSM